MKNIEIIGLGALNIDHLYQVERILADGETAVQESALFPGGSAANTIYGLAKLGANTGFAGVVGNDAESEILVQEAIEHLLEGRTTFVIAHRLSTIQNADRIIVLENGVLRECGTHQELLTADGVYKKLYDLQFGLVN